VSLGEWFDILKAAPLFLRPSSSRRIVSAVGFLDALTLINRDTTFIQNAGTHPKRPEFKKSITFQNFAVELSKPMTNCVIEGAEIMCLQSLTDTQNYEDF
jgi:hypothetical protein